MGLGFPPGGVYTRKTPEAYCVEDRGSGVREDTMLETSPL